MQVQRLSRKVTSKTQVRSSSGSSKLTHSWASAGARGTGPEAAPMAAWRAGVAARSATSCRVAVIWGAARARSLPERVAAGQTGAVHAAHDVVAAELARALAPGRVHSEPLELALYGRDASILSGRASVVCFPQTAAEVQAAVRIARAHGRAIVPRGSGTGLAGGAGPVGGGGADPGGLGSTRMNKIHEVDAEGRAAREGAGRHPPGPSRAPA